MQKLLDKTEEELYEVRGEVERLQGALKAEETHNELTMECAKKSIANAKAEVAREIFEEIEKWIAYDGDIRMITDKKFAEIKKKYTECNT